MPQNATIHIADPSMLSFRIFDQLEGVECYEGISDGDTAKGVRFKFPWGRITMSFMQPEKLADHLEGFSGWVQHEMQNSDALIYTLARVHYIRMVIGCVIEHEEAASGEAFDFLLRFNLALNGLLFVADSLIDFTGDALAGPLAEEDETQDARDA